MCVIFTIGDRVVRFDFQQIGSRALYHMYLK